MSYEHMFQACPTCGADVVVHTGEEGTSSYQPRYGKGSNMPVPSTYVEVASLLRDMAAHVEAGDSFEGSLQYGIPEMPEVETSEPQPEVMLRAVYRIGNSLGQGGVRIIGSEQ